MKNIALLSAALSALIITGCSSIQMPTQGNKAASSKKAPTQKKEKATSDTLRYQCDKKAVVQAKYNPLNDTALVTITAPNLRLNKQEVQMAIAQSGSGSRYLNDTNPASIYEWHTKGDTGLLSITAGKKEYVFSCKAH